MINKSKNVKDTIKKLVIIAIFVITIFNISATLAEVVSNEINVSAFVLPPAGDKSANLIEFSTGQKLYEYSDVDFKVRLKNTGNIYIYPQGTIEIIKGADSESVFIDINNGKIVIQPDQTQNLMVDWDNPGKYLIGKYSAKLKIDYGNSQIITSEVSFWIAPVYSFVITLISIIILYFVLHLSPIQLSKELHFGKYTYRRG
jgi:hypothetical protein